MNLCQALGYLVRRRSTCFFCLPASLLDKALTLAHHLRLSLTYPSIHLLLKRSPSPTTSVARSRIHPSIHHGIRLQRIGHHFRFLGHSYARPCVDIARTSVIRHSHHHAEHDNLHPYFVNNEEIRNPCYYPRSILSTSSGKGG